MHKWFIVGAAFFLLCSTAAAQVGEPTPTVSYEQAVFGSPTSQPDNGSPSSSAAATPGDESLAVLESIHADQTIYFQLMLALSFLSAGVAVLAFLRSRSG